MSNPKWQVGPVKLANGWDGNILLFCDHRKIYLGTYKVPGGGVHCFEWLEDGTSYYGQNDYRLAPPPKKKVRVRGWLNVYANGSASFWKNKDNADSQTHRFACLKIDRDVEEDEEGEGLS